MKVKLLKKLRKEAYKRIKIRYDVIGTYSIIDTYYDTKYHFDTDICSITEAKQKLIIARRVFITNQVKELKLIRFRKITKEINKELSKY